MNLVCETVICHAEEINEHAPALVLQALQRSSSICNKLCVFVVLRLFSSLLYYVVEVFVS